MFVVFEGIDGSGKSTQARLLVRALKNRGRRVLFVREPGSTRIGERIRRILLDRRSTMSPVCELLLYMAARAQLIEERIRPALGHSEDVVCDRFVYSSAAYQGEAGRLGIPTVMDIAKHVTRHLVPDRVFVLDLAVRDALARRTGKTPDRIERRSIDYHQRVRRGFLKVARTLGRRGRILDGRLDPKTLHRSVLKNLGIKS